MCLSFIGGAVLATVVPRIIHAAADRLLFPETRTEVSRVSSPDGIVDAVVQRINCGTPCSGYAVSIVAKGATAAGDPNTQIFLAEDVANAQIRWSEPHLLDISYDKALINSFRNVTHPLGKLGNIESWHYAVEVHLSPSSATFSYLGDSRDPKNHK